MRRVKKQVAASSSSNPPSARKTPSMSSKKKKEEENWRSMVADSQETIVLSSSRETAGMEKVSTKLARIIANEASAVTIAKTPDDHHFDFEDEESESEEADGRNIHNSDNS
jgi:sugar-specific transcriptional regulator TrmB